MKSCKFLLCSLAVILCFSGCSEENMLLSQKEQNELQLQTIAKEVGADVKIELFNEHASRSLSSKEIEYYRNEFKGIAAMTNSSIELIPKKNSSRVVETCIHNGSVGYDGHSFDLFVCWYKDNETGDIFEIYGGLGGENEDSYNPYDRTHREMIHMGQTIHYANSEQISLSLKADYVVSVYTAGSFGDNLSSQITSKVTASGIVYIASDTSSFTVASAGPGSWGEDWRDETAG